MTENLPAFKAEKQNVLGELSNKFRQFGTSDEENFPPPPPVFQTYAVSNTDDDEDLPPPPPFLQRKQSDVTSPPPPPPPAISPPDYSKLSAKKKDDDNCTPPKLQPVGSQDNLYGRRSSTPETKNSNPYTNTRSMSYADMNQHVAERKVLPEPKASISVARDDQPASERVGMSAPSPANKEETNSKKDECYKCSEKLEIGGIEALGRGYHKGCFQCADCGKVLMARFNAKDGEPFCDKCYEEAAERCFVCDAIVVGDSLKSGDKYFHTYCMKCSVCGEELTGTYFTSGNAFICEKDYKESLDKCGVCGDLLTGNFYKVEGINLCEKDYKNQLSSCSSCNKTVEGKLLKLSERVFHPDCFNCSVCGINLAGMQFSQDETKKIFCTEDFQRKYASRCHGCGYAIIPEKGQNSAERVRVQGKDFHPQCFKCQDCGLVFDSRVPGRECYPLGEAFLCKPCNLNRPNRQ